ncbi:conserved hypothetical protein [Nostocoides japonicum T1-X7]|uniref:DUF3618 domain-containing protein n=1 Tax=Nostocoides japonicum T1-X7 TaxID=1194083 RepID=A0A077LY00_9MICO|nr:DUF3618 domain-containing protein [Tetrasphaera japonica]CCH78778.1 conserved hypothetical protein [Tetrasphaera japonica T1-X7]
MSNADVPAKAAPPSIADLEADLAERRQRLARTIDELTEQIKPKAIVRRQTEQAKARFAAATTTPEGDLRTERIAAVVLASVGILTVVFLLRRRRG